MNHTYIRRAKALLSRPTEDVPDHTTWFDKSISPDRVRRIQRVFLKSPWDDFVYIRALNESVLARHKTSFLLVELKETPSFSLIGESPLLSLIHHPNIAAIFDMYCHEDKTYLAIEYLQVSFNHLYVDRYELEEREIATILAEVVTGVNFLSSLKISCKSLSAENLRFSLDGDIKLVLDLDNLEYDHSYQGPKVSQALLDFPILAEIIENMILSRYHLTEEDERWSKDALDFLSCALEHSFARIEKHCFLQQAVSPQRLIPRIRFAYEAQLGSSDDVTKEDETHS